MNFAIYTSRGYVVGKEPDGQVTFSNDATKAIMFDSSPAAGRFAKALNLNAQVVRMVVVHDDPLTAEARVMAVEAIARDAVRTLKHIEELATGPYWETKRRWAIGKLAEELAKKLRVGLIGGDK